MNTLLTLQRPVALCLDAVDDASGVHDDDAHSSTSPTSPPVAQTSLSTKAVVKKSRCGLVLPHPPHFTFPDIRRQAQRRPSMSPSPSHQQQSVAPQPSPQSPASAALFVPRSIEEHVRAMCPAIGACPSPPLSPPLVPNSRSSQSQNSKFITSDLYSPPVERPVKWLNPLGSRALLHRPSERMKPKR